MAGVGTTGIPRAGGLAGGGGFGAAGGFRQLMRNSAPIKRAQVGMPNQGDYAPPTTRPTITLPTRDQFGAAPSREHLDAASRDVTRYRREFNDPTKSTAFTSLMGLATEQTGAAVGEAHRQSRDNASRAGYSGGFNASAKQAQRDQMSSLAETGFKGAAQIREEAGGMYETARASLDAQTTSYNSAQTAINNAFGNALASAHETQGQLDLGFASIVAQSNMGFADAKAEAQRLQAQLDNAFNSSLIDNAKYTQMQRSLDNEFASAQAMLAEKARQFDLTRKDSLQSRDDALSLQAKGMTSAGIDPATGKRLGWANPPRGRLGMAGR